MSDSDWRGVNEWELTRMHEGKCWCSCHNPNSQPVKCSCKGLKAKGQHEVYPLHVKEQLRKRGI